MSVTDAVKPAAELSTDGTRRGHIKARARAIGTDHELALALWAEGGLNPRLLATLIPGSTPRPATD